MHFDGYVEIAGSSDGLPWLLLITNALSASIVHWYRSKEQQHAAAGRKREKESIRIPIIPGYKETIRTLGRSQQD